jgi:hypothetical protein
MEGLDDWAFHPLVDWWIAGFGGFDGSLGRWVGWLVDRLIVGLAAWRTRW